MNRLGFFVGIGIAALTYAGLSTCARADVQFDAIGVHIGSRHYPQANWNNSNPGIYAKFNVKDSWAPSGNYVVGSYYNSERHQSVYAAYNYPVTSWLDVSLGAITGYEAHKIMPLVAPSVHFPIFNSGFSARIFYLPKVEKTGAHVIHLSLERKF